MHSRPPDLSAHRVQRARAAITAAAGASLDADGLLGRVLAALADAVPYASAALTTIDPDTLLCTGGVVCGMPDEVLAGRVEREMLDAASIAAGAVAGTTPCGAPELRMAFTSGERCFGAGRLEREPGGAPFTATEVALVADAAQDVAEGLRAALSVPRAPAPDDRPAGVLVVDDARRVLSATDAATAWLDDLGGGVPLIVHAVVVRARARAEGRTGPPARARALTASGAWVSVHASALSGDQRAWAVVIEPARRTDVLPLLAEAHDLTPREQEVLTLLVRGLPDRAVAEELVVSPHTAREHAGRVLRKFGVRSRGELQALLYHERRAPSPRRDPHARA